MVERVVTQTFQQSDYSDLEGLFNAMSEFVSEYVDKDADRISSASNTIDMNDIGITLWCREASNPNTWRLKTTPFDDLHVIDYIRKLVEDNECHPLLIYPSDNGPEIWYFESDSVA